MNSRQELVVKAFQDLVGPDGVVTSGQIAEKSGLKVTSVAQLMRVNPLFKKVGGVCASVEWRRDADSEG